LKPKDIREKTSEELQKQLAELNEEFFRLKFKFAIGQLEQTTNLKNTKKNIAKVKTILRERELKG
jgi:large subunit ribosomal protein L29